MKSLSRLQLVATPWTAAYQAPPSMGFSRQEYWSGLPLPSPEKFTSDYNLVFTLLKLFTALVLASVETDVLCLVIHNCFEVGSTF